MFVKSRPREAGIAPCAPDILGDEFYNIVNRWDAVVDGRYVSAFAGSLLGNPADGVLVIRVLPMDCRRKSGRHYFGPSGAGTLRIVDSDGRRLKIRCASGGSYWFELPERREPASRMVA